MIKPNEHMVYKFNPYMGFGPYPFIENFYKYFSDYDVQDIEKAIIKAKQARFEHGECG